MKYKIVTENRNDILCRTIVSAYNKLVKLRKTSPCAYHRSYIATRSGQRCYFGSKADLIAQEKSDA